jgi:hypothetical protein
MNYIYESYMFIVFMWVFPICFYMIWLALRRFPESPGGRLGGPKGSLDQRPGEAARHLGTGPVSQRKGNSHRIHGAAIYGNMDPINIPPLC